MGIKSGIEITVDRVKTLASNLKTLVSQDVLVGVPEQKTDRDPEPGEPAGITNAMIGYLAEVGSPAQNIPARPHLHPGIMDAKDALATQLGAAFAAALDGHMDEVQVRLNRAGLIAQASVRARIISGPFVPLAASTLAARKRRGFEGEAPLQESGQYKQAINYVLRKQ